MKRYMSASPTNLEENGSNSKKGKLNGANCMLRAFDYTGVTPEALFQEVIQSVEKLPRNPESLDQLCKYINDVVCICPIEEHRPAKPLHTYPSCIRGLIQAFDPIHKCNSEKGMNSEVKNDLKFSIATLHLACTLNKKLTRSITRLCREWDYINCSLDCECAMSLIDLLVYCHLESFEEICLSNDTQELEFFFASLLFIENIRTILNSDAYSSYGKALEAVCQLAFNKNHVQSLVYEGLYQYLTYDYSPLILPLGSLCIASLPQGQILKDCESTKRYRNSCGIHQHDIRAKLIDEGEKVCLFSGVDKAENIPTEDRSKFLTLIYFEQQASISHRSSILTALLQILIQTGKVNENAALERLSKIDRSAFEENLLLQVISVHFFRKYVLLHENELSQLCPTRQLSSIAIQAYALSVDFLKKLAGEACRNEYQGLTETKALGVPALIFAVDIISRFDPRWLDNMLSQPETFKDLRSILHSSTCTLFQTELTDANRSMMNALYTRIAPNIENFIDFKCNIPPMATTTLWRGLQTEAKNPCISHLVDIYHALIHYGDRDAVKCSIESLGLIDRLPPPLFAKLASEAFSKIQSKNVQDRSKNMLVFLQEILVQAQKHVSGDETSLSRIVLRTMKEYKNAIFGESLMQLVEVAGSSINIQTDTKDKEFDQGSTGIEIVLRELLVCFSSILPEYPALASTGVRAILNLVQSLHLLNAEIDTSVSSLVLGSMLFVLDNREQLEAKDPRILVYTIQTVQNLIQEAVHVGDFAYIRKLPFTKVLLTNLYVLEKESGLEVRNNVENLLELLDTNVEETKLTFSHQLDGAKIRNPQHLIEGIEEKAKH